MKKYLKELEISGIAMMFIGIIMGRLLGSDICTLIIIIGMLLWVFTVVYKAFHWQEFRRDNILNIIIMLGAIIAIFITFTTLAK